MVMNKKKIRDLIYLVRAFFFFWLYIPHLFCYILSNNKNDIDKDLDVLSLKLNVKLAQRFSLLYFLHNSSYFRTLFYHRIGSVMYLLIGWYRPGCRSFLISQTTKIKGGVLFVHPYSSILNADYIGENFSFRNLTTLGSNNGQMNRPIILDNVSLGVAVTIIGKVTIGNNVTIGAGCVVTKSIPDNCVVIGNPARIIKRDGIKVSEQL